MKKISLQLEIPVKYDVDVCVTGAGPAGCAAAVCAAEQGANVLLIEAAAMAGGMSTAARVPVYMPFLANDKLLCEGFGRRVLTALKERSRLMNYKAGSAINAEHLKFISEELLQQAGVHVLYYSRLAHVQAENGTVKHAVFAAPGGTFGVKAKIFVDASGDGTLAAWGGAPFERGDQEGNVMPSTLCPVWAGFDWDAYRAGGTFSHNDDNMLALLERAFQNGELPQEDYHHTGVFRVSKHAAVGNFSHVFNIDATDEESLTRGIMHNRKLLQAYEQFYRKHVPGFADAEIVDSGSVLGVRESRRIFGDYVLCRADYEARRHFDDEIGSYNFPADIHPPRPGKAEILEHKKLFKGSHYAPGETYGIPYRVLLAQKLDNVLTCGRCVSTDRHVQASLRVIPGCYITGQAAGLAAALAADANTLPRRISVPKLQSLIPVPQKWNWE